MRIATRTVAANKFWPSIRAGILFVALGVGIHPLPASAQVLLTPGELDQLVSRVALYPDPLLAQVLTYDPPIVLGRSSVGLAAGIMSGPRIAVGAAFAPWGWGRSGTAKPTLA